MKNIETLWNKYSHFSIAESRSLMDKMNFAKALMEFYRSDKKKNLKRLKESEK